MEHPAAEGPHLAGNHNLVYDELHVLFADRESSVVDAAFYDFLEDRGHLALGFENVFPRRGGQGLRFLIQEYDIVLHLVDYFVVGADCVHELLLRVARDIERRPDSRAHARVYVIADEEEDVFLGADVFVERPDAHAELPRDLADGGLVEALFDEQLDGGVYDFHPAGLDELLVLDLGLDVLYRSFHIS